MNTFKRRPVIRIIDFETGHAPTEDSNGVIEVGYCDIVARSQDLVGSPTDWIFKGDQYQSFVSTPHDLEPDYQGIHHITKDDLMLAKSWDDVLPHIGHVTDPQFEIVAFAAFGIDTEVRLLGDAAQAFPWVCLHKVALRLWPQSPRHSNQVLRYFLDMDPPFDPKNLLPAHRALPDARVTALHLLAALNGHEFNEPHSMEELIDWTTKPSLLPRCRVGEWRGKDGRGTPWENVDSGMLDWILRKRSDPDELFTARYHLDKREVDQREESERREMNRQFAANGMLPMDDENKPAEDNRPQQTEELPL